MAAVGHVKIDNVPICFSGGSIGNRAHGFTGSRAARLAIKPVPMQSLSLDRCDAVRAGEPSPPPPERAQL